MSKRSDRKRRNRLVERMGATIAKLKIIPWVPPEPEPPPKRGPEYHALLRAVLANPADDLCRLMVADWFEENNEPLRAEFIRVAVESAALDENPNAGLADLQRMDALLVRRGELYREYGREWFPDAFRHTMETFGRVDCGFVRRGFVDTVRIGLFKFFNAGHVLLESNPIARWYTDSVPLATGEMPYPWLLRTNGWDFAHIQPATRYLNFIPRTIFDLIKPDGAVAITGNLYGENENELELAMIAAGTLTINEFRQRHALPPIAGGDVVGDTETGPGNAANVERSLRWRTHNAALNALGGAFAVHAHMRAARAGYREPPTPAETAEIYAAGARLYRDEEAEEPATYESNSDAGPENP